MRFPDPLVEERHGTQARFGYEAAPAAAILGEPDDAAWTAMWDRLKPDFATATRPEVPAFAILSADVQARARDYMSCRLRADRLLQACKAAHTRLAHDGIATAAVEHYAEVRDAYEDGVMAFGAARARLEAILPKPTK